MNKVRRKQIDDVLKNINSLQNMLDELQQSIEEIKDDEQDYLDNIPENLQNSERYEAAENALCNLEDTKDKSDFCLLVGCFGLVATVCCLFFG